MNKGKRDKKTDSEQYILKAINERYLTLKKALKPIKNLGVAAQQFAQQRDVVSLPANGPTEILPTIDAFNQMQIKLAQFIDDQRKMLAAISHDLKTPITTMRLRLEFLQTTMKSKSYWLRSIRWMLY